MPKNTFQKVIFIILIVAIIIGMVVPFLPQLMSDSAQRAVSKPDAELEVEVE